MEINDIIINKRLILILKNLLNLPIEVSGQFEINTSFEIDIIGMFLSRSTHVTFYPTGNILFHSHPGDTNINQIFWPPSDMDYFGTVNNFILYDKDPYEIIITKEGIYVYRLSDEWKDSLIINIKKTNKKNYEDMLSYWQIDLAAYGLLYNGNIDLIKQISEQSTHEYSKKIYTNMLKLKNNKFTFNDYKEKILELGFIIDLYKWPDNDENIKIKNNIPLNKLYSNNILNWETSGSNNDMYYRNNYLFDHEINTSYNQHKGLLDEYNEEFEQYKKKIN